MKIVHKIDVEILVLEYFYNQLGTRQPPNPRVSLNHLIASIPTEYYPAVPLATRTDPNRPEAS